MPQAFVGITEHFQSMDYWTMPETNYKAAAQVIERWEKDFPDTYMKLETLDMPIKQFVEGNC